MDEGVDDVDEEGTAAAVADDDDDVVPVFLRCLRVGISFPFPLVVDVDVDVAAAVDADDECDDEEEEEEEHDNDGMFTIVGPFASSLERAPSNVRPSFSPPLLESRGVSFSRRICSAVTRVLFLLSICLVVGSSCFAAGVAPPASTPVAVAGAVAPAAAAVVALLCARESVGRRLLNARLSRYACRHKCTKHSRSNGGIENGDDEDANDGGEDEEDEDDEEDDGFEGTALVKEELTVMLELISFTVPIRLSSASLHLPSFTALPRCCMLGCSVSR